MKSIDTPLIGAVYLVEPNVPPQRQQLDLTNIARAGMNLVVLWPPVSRWDSHDGVSIAFDSIDRTMDTCAKLSLRVVLELEGQNPAFQFAPDARHAPDRAPLSDRARHWINYFHPQVAEEIDEYVRTVAEHFKDHPALWAYDLFNEVNFHSTDQYTQRKFHRWLAEKYDRIGQLNHVWGRFYSSFDQICLDNLDAPYSKWSSLRPLLDFEDFRADAIVMLVRRWADVVRSVDPHHPVIADVSWSMTTFDTTMLGNDDWKVAQAVDILGLSVYPQSWDVRLRDNPCAISQILRGGVCAGNVSRHRPIMISELQTHNQTALARGSSVFDEIRLWTWQAFAHGVEALAYWKWNPFTRGFQVAGRGMTGPDGQPNDRAAQAAECAKVIRQAGQLLIGRTVFDSGVAILYSPTCDRFTDLILPDEPGLYRRSLAGWYRHLWNKGVTPSILQPQDLPAAASRDTKLLIIPCLAMLSRQDADRIRRFASPTRKIIADGRFAIVDENGFAYDQPPGGLTDTFGYVETDFLSPYHDQGSAAGERFSVITLTNAQAAAKTRLDHVLAARSEKTLYLATPFGLAIDNTRLAGIVDDFLTPQLDRRCEVLDHSQDVDVVISHGPGVMLAAVNYSHQPQQIRAKLDATAPVRSLWPGTHYKVDRDHDTTFIECTVPARGVAGLVITDEN